jgi:hypothetical protein
MYCDNQENLYIAPFDFREAEDNSKINKILLKENTINLIDNINITHSDPVTEYNEKKGLSINKQKFAVNKSIQIISNSNSNYINPCRSSSKKESKIKIPYFKEYNFKFTKRENIDKKLLRKTKKYLKSLLKKQKINFNNMDLDESQKKFWLNFLSSNLLPPMKYSDEETNENVEFKSFNTNYMAWLFSHKGSIELYQIYLNNNFDDVMSIFFKKFNIKENEEKEYLFSYIENFAKIFNSFNLEKNNNLKETEDNICNLHIQSEIASQSGNGGSSCSSNCAGFHEIFGDVKFDNM